MKLLHRVFTRRTTQTSYNTYSQSSRIARTLQVSDVELKLNFYSAIKVRGAEHQSKPSSLTAVVHRKKCYPRIAEHLRAVWSLLRVQQCMAPSLSSAALSEWLIRHEKGNNWIINCPATNKWRTLNHKKLLFYLVNGLVSGRATDHKQRVAIISLWIVTFVSKSIWGIARLT